MTPIFQALSDEYWPSPIFQVLSDECWPPTVFQALSDEYLVRRRTSRLRISMAV